jgi:hypothetical protein
MKLDVYHSADSNFVRTIYLFETLSVHLLDLFLKYCYFRFINKWKLS